MYIDKLI